MRLKREDRITMIHFKQAKVLEILAQRKGITQVKAKIDDEIFQALNYDDMTGSIEAGDNVILNTIAIELGLGTGGTHFVLWNLRNQALTSSSNGHIMKLRYTPLQFNTLSVEEQKSPFHNRVKNSTDIRGMPVVVGSLHSQLPAVVATIKELNPRLRIAYIMTDAAALPIALSDLVAKLKELHLIDATITCGNAFGGDLEAINIFSALIAAKEAAEVDICVVMMGPGIVGTDTALGYSGIEQGVILNAVGTLKGAPIAILRLHFADKRARHYGISHHSLTALSLATLVKTTVVLPNMSTERKNIVLRQLEESAIASKHDIVEINSDLTIAALKNSDLNVTTMGRTVSEEPDFFRAAGAGGIYAVRHLEKGAK